MSFLEKGNIAFKNEDYELALGFYKKAISERDYLKDILDFNISFCENKLSLGRGLNNNSSNLSQKSDDEKKAVIKEYLEYKKTRKATVVVYMAIIGGYDKLILPDEIVFDWDYVLFTDANLKGVSPFEVREPLYSDFDKVRIARYHKLNPHIVLNEYDYTIWIDGNIQIKSGSFKALIEEEIDLETELLMRKHPDRNCTYDEILKCRELLKDDFGLMSRQLNKYQSEGFPKDSGLFETNVIFRDNRSKRVQEFNDIWWNELKNWSRRDQLSCVYALKKAILLPELFPDNVDIRDPNNYYYSLFPHTSNANKKLKPYKDESIYKLIPPNLNGAKEFLYSTGEVSYSVSKAPYKVKRAFLNARDLGFYLEGISELKRLALKGSKREKNWSNWLLGILLANSDDSNERSEAKSFVLKSELEKEIPSFDKFKSFILRELSGEDLSLPLNSLVNADDDSLYQSISFEKDISKKVDLFNVVFERYGLQRIRVLGEKKSYLDNVYSESPIKRTEFIKSDKKVTIIIPCYKCEDTIETTIFSLTMQTWLNLEIFLVDDCSPDNTISTLNRFADLDSRIKVISTNSNSGPYVARNVALSMATGDYITVCDSDDWCHPQKIEYQVSHFERYPDIVANCASWVRCDNSFNFIRRGQPFYAHLNISSLMFKKSEVLERLGGWDEVRFAADGEFYKRLIRVFGRDKVVELKGITSIGRVESTSLTNSSYFGYNGFPYGARLEYLRSYESWHQKDDGISHLYYQPGQAKRLFPVPYPMQPERAPNNCSSFDTVVACDLRDEQLQNEVLELVLREERNNRSWTLVQVNCPSIDARLKVSERIRELLNQHNKCLTVYGETISCENLYYFENGQEKVTSNYLPSVKANHLKLIITSEPNEAEVYSDSLFESLSELFEYKSQELVLLSAKCLPESLSGEKVHYLFDEIVKLNMSELHQTTFNVSPSVTIVMPCIDEELGMKTANILSSRAGTGCTVVVAMDDLRNGFMSTLNTVSALCDSRFIVFVAQDAFPGRDWLKIALKSIEAKKAGLLAFNDGKWLGRIASFGLVRKAWINKYYDGAILNPYYKAHKADNEITVLARLDDSFVYEPNSTLIEVDYRKDAGGSNPDDNEKFKLRFNSCFDGAFPEELVETFRKEYKVKNDK